MPLDRLIPADEALEIVLAGAEPNPSVSLSLREAENMVLAEDLASLRTQPPFDASSMDGYAVIGADLTELPCKLDVIGESKAGTPFNDKVSSGKAVRIFTGAVVPDGADTIIIQENTNTSAGKVEILQSSPIGKFIRQAGLDFKTGETLLNKGDILTPNCLSLAASMNHASVKVHSKPRVALIATGDELVLPGNELGEGQIIASNTFGIQASARNSGAEVLDLGIAIDTREALTASLRDAVDQDADIIVTTGGASVGDHDLVLPVATKFGFKFEIAKIAMRPGKPFLFAKLKRGGKSIYLIGLAGNPVSSLIAFNVFAKPLIARLLGLPDTVNKPLPAILGCDLPANDERMEYMRAMLELSADGSRIATPFSKQDSSMLANLVRAQCLVIRPANAKASPKGEACKIIILD